MCRSVTARKYNISLGQVKLTPLSNSSRENEGFFSHFFLGESAMYYVYDESDIPVNSEKTLLHHLNELCCSCAWRNTGTLLNRKRTPFNTDGIPPYRILHNGLFPLLPISG